MALARMFSGIVNTVHVVAASKDGHTDYWIAATRRKEATTAVQHVVGPAYLVRLTNRQLTASEIAALNLRPDEVRQWHD
jgi:hypothetical protein